MLSVFWKTSRKEGKVGKLIGNLNENYFFSYDFLVYIYIQIKYTNLIISKRIFIIFQFQIILAPNKKSDSIFEFLDFINQNYFL